MNDALPRPGETWLSRDGRVAWVFQNPDPGTREAYPIAAEYSDGAYCPLLTTGRYFATIGLWSPADLTLRSPWDAIREALLGSGKFKDLLSECLEFVAWAELRGLTPENLASMRGKVAA